MRTLSAVGACFAVVLALSAHNARAQAIYFGAEGGWSTLADQHDGPAGLPAAHVLFDSGFAVGMRAGYELGRWRFEEEYAYRRNGVSGARFGGTKLAGLSGSRRSHAIMTNILYAFDLGWPVSPHIGAGIGAVDIADEARASGLGLVGDDDWRFGYQAIGGLRYPISPKIAVDIDYRYLAATAATLKIAAAPATRYRSSYSDHTVMASLVYRFGPPPPPPPVIAPPAPATTPTAAGRRVFLVFFDRGQAAISPQGRRVVRQAADAYRSGAPVRLQLTGYTNRSGSTGYDRLLSERRADNVALALAGFGVPRDLMSVSGRGASNPRVATAAGGRAPQNRRVEIVFP